jgi:hypothetical protein
MDWTTIWAITIFPKKHLVILVTAHYNGFIRVKMGIRVGSEEE